MDKPLVRIEWNDAADYTQSAWASEESAKEFTDKLVPVISVGWLVKKSKHYVCIASDYDTESLNYGTLRKIPKKMIVKITPIHEIKPDTPSEP